jgi:hypothetical protein
MKKLFRAAFGDESRVLIILADDIDEAVDIANETVNGDDDPEDWAFTFTSDNDSVFEVDLEVKSQAIEDFSIDSFA